MFRNYMRLTVDKWGLIETAPQSFEFSVAKEPNLSTVEYELIEFKG